MTLWNPMLADSIKPRYLALADAIEQSLENGSLQPGEKLPTHRELAGKLGVTVGTVTRGYAEAAKRGLVRGETGRGTFAGPAGSAGPALTITETEPDLADLSFTGPMHGIEPELGPALAELAKARDVNGLLRYFPARGRLRDRRIGAKWLERFGLRTTADNVLVCAGGQSALNAILMAMFRPGDHIATDPLTYPLFKSLCRRYGVTPCPVPQDDHGMIPGELDTICARKNVRGLYLMPVFHNPLTTGIPDYRRNELAETARKWNLNIIVDDAYALSVENPGTPLAGMAPERTFSIGSISKSVAGGLRIAYVYSPDEYVTVLEQALADAIWTASPITAELAARFIESGAADRTARRKREEARRRNLIADEELAGLAYRSRPTGFFLWISLPSPWRSNEFAQEAAARGVPVLSDENFLVGRTPSSHAVRVALGNTLDMDKLRKGLRTIRDMALSGP